MDDLKNENAFFSCIQADFFLFFFLFTCSEVKEKND